MKINKINQHNFVHQSKFEQEIKQAQSKHNPSFKKYKFHILDGGAHGSYMEHFAKAATKKIPAEVNVQLHKVDLNAKIPALKQLKSLEAELRYMNDANLIQKGDYVTIPSGVLISLLNIRERMGYILWKYPYLSPQNVKDNSASIVEMLKRAYDDKDRFKEQMRLLDDKQDLEYTYGVINEVNKLVEKGANVYIPSGHPDDNTIKWRAKERGLNPDLYRYISHPETCPSPDLKLMIEEIRNNNWYDLNLLALSDANIVNVKGVNDRDFLFSAYDSCVNDSARGVFNLSPVRDASGNLRGYSFFDETTIEYPLETFPHNDKIRNITKFVGLKARDFIADTQEHERFKYYVENGLDTNSLPDKLYRIKDIYPEREIKQKKLNYLGEYIDNTQKLVFDINSKDQILFQKLNYEGSEKPSVFAMWGSCFATMNAVSRDIELAEAKATANAKVATPVPAQVETSKTSKDEISLKDWLELGADALKILVDAICNPIVKLHY